MTASFASYGSECGVTIPRVGCDSVNNWLTTVRVHLHWFLRLVIYENAIDNRKLLSYDEVSISI